MELSAGGGCRYGMAKGGCIRTEVGAKKIEFTLFSASGVRLHGLVFCELLVRKYPSRLGRSIQPADSVNIRARR